MELNTLIIFIIYAVIAFLLLLNGNWSSFDKDDPCFKVFVSILWPIVFIFFIAIIIGGILKGEFKGED